MTRIFSSLTMIVMLALASALSGCSDGGAPPAETPVAETAAPTPAPQRAEPTDVQLVAWMEAHYSDTILAHDALMQGDMPAFRAQLDSASKLALPPGVPEAWVPLYATFRSAAGSGARAESLAGGARAMTAVVLSCGTCHTALARGPVYPAPAPDDAINEFQAAMFDHRWAAERLWEGVTGPWDLAWERGAAALAETRVFGEALGELDGDLLQREQALQALGQEAQRTTDTHARAAIYARLLASCGDCHSLAGVVFERDD